MAGRTTTKIEDNPSLDLVCLRRFFRLCKVFLTRDVQLLALLLFISSLEQFVAFSIGMITPAFYKILADLDGQAFGMQVIKAIVLVSVMSLILSTKEYVTSSLRISWRKSITTHLHERYFNNVAFYDICRYSQPKRDNQGNGNSDENKSNAAIDTPDQRMTQDVNEFVIQLSKVLPTIILAPFVISYYSYHSFMVIGILGPIGCFVFFLLSTVINRILMKSIVSLVYQQEKMEGNFRFHHMTVRSNAESIAMTRGQTVEEMTADYHFRNLLNVQENLILKQFFLSLSVNGAAYLGAIVSFLIIAIPIFAGIYNDMKPTERTELVGQNAFVSMYLIGWFTRLLNMSSDIATVAGTTHRIVQMMEAIEETSRKRSEKNREFNGNGDNSESVADQQQLDTFYEVKDLTIVAGSGMDGGNDEKSPLFHHWSFKFEKGINVLICGKSGSGKTSILRVLSGLWFPVKGNVIRSIGESRVLFLPDKGSVSSAVSDIRTFCGPIDDTSLDGSQDGKLAEVHKYLKLFDIDSNIRRHFSMAFQPYLDDNWIYKLSPGEIQRLSFIRVLLTRPDVVFLDEATNSIPEDMEAKFYDELQKKGITYVTCGHKNSLWRHHDVQLFIRGYPIRVEVNYLDSYYRKKNA